MTVEGDGGVGSKSHWTIEGPMGKNFEYDAETTADEDGKIISWRTVGSTAVQHAGTARFRDAPRRPGDRGPPRGPVPPPPAAAPWAGLATSS